MAQGRSWSQTGSPPPWIKYKTTKNAWKKPGFKNMLHRKRERVFSILALALVESGEKVAFENLWLKVSPHERLGIEFTHLETEKP